MQFAVQVDVSELLLSDIEIGTVHLSTIIEIPMRRRDNSRPGLNLQRYGLRRPFQLWRWPDFAFRFKPHWPRAFSSLFQRARVAFRPTDISVFHRPDPFSRASGWPSAWPSTAHDRAELFWRQLHQFAVVAEHINRSVRSDAN